MTNKQVDRFLDILDRAVGLATRVIDKEYPVADASQIEIYEAGKQQEPDSPEAYDAFEGPGRFESRFSNPSST